VKIRSDDTGVVTDLVTKALPVTAQLAIGAFILWITFGVSIGIAVADAHDSAETVLAKADAAMYRAKNDRREWQGAA
jgi:GGDEF domain-containing protein